MAASATAVPSRSAKELIMSPLEERFTVVILCQGRVVRLLGRGFSLSLALALVRSAGRVPDPDGVPALVPQWIVPQCVDWDVERVEP
jgi:hypothetical protein